ncbi:MAG: hypothetical protein JW976_12885 [Syntrophaceae bacterium]|nr:hypothetical protein [Syntrophaceae bacterium]
MENEKMMKQMIELHKTSVKNCFSVMEMLQKQAENFMKTFINYSPEISSEGKKVIDQWTDAYNKGVDNLKKAIDDGYDKVEELFDSSAMSIFQEQTEKMFNDFFNQKSLMPLDLKKNMEELAATYKKGYDDFNKYLNENVKRMEKLYSVASKKKTKDKD